MSQTVLAEGKDVTEAIDQGLGILGVNKEEVSIEVVQQAQKGFLRLGSKRAIVKLTKTITSKKRKANKEADFSMEMIEKMIDKMEINLHGENDLHPICKPSLEEDLEGKVWIKGSRVFCKNSQSHYPTITSCHGLKLLKNNELVAGKTAVTEKDHFELQTVEEVKETKWKITMDSNRLNVYLHVEPGMRKTYKVKDKNPGYHIYLEAEEIIEINNDLNYKQVLERIGELRVIHGFNHSEIMKAVNTKSAGRFTIASGIKPKEGENGKIEIIVDTEKKFGPKERANGTVDFREVQVIPAVQKGQVIAIIHPTIPGSPGYTVTNEPLPPKPTYPLIIQQGKGITLIENGTKMVATEAGRPIIDQRGLLAKVSIVPKIIHPSDVNISSGNIRFKGDVDVLGNIEEGMVVEANGNIDVLKNAYSASISSKSALSIHGNSIGSTISAGKQNNFTSDMVNLLSNIREQMEKLILSIIQLMNMPAIKKIDTSRNGILPIIKLLLDRKFQLLLRDVKKYIALNKKGSHLLDIEWLTLAEQLRLCFLTAIPNEFHSFERMNELLKKIEKMVEKHDDKMDQECFVKLKYALNSEIYSGGDVIINGHGCYNSKIHAGRNLIINGVFRGGEVYARVGAAIKESGSEGGVVSKIMVPSDGTIKIDHAREGTVIQIGKTKFTFQTEQRYITARLNENGKIIF